MVILSSLLVLILATVADAQFLPNTHYDCQFPGLSMNCQPIPIVPPAPTPVPPPAPPPVVPPAPVPAPSITITGLQPIYTVDLAGTKIHAQITVTVRNFQAVKLEISRDTFLPFYTLTTPGPTWTVDYCVNCFRPDEPLPRSSVLKARATDASGKIITTSFPNQVNQATPPPIPDPPPPPPISGGDGAIHARQLPTADTLDIYVGMNSTTPSTVLMKTVQAITVSAGSATWRQYDGVNRHCHVLVDLNGKPPDQKLLPPALTVKYADGTADTLPVEPWVPDIGNLNDPAIKALLGIQIARWELIEAPH